MAGYRGFDGFNKQQQRDELLHALDGLSSMVLLDDPSSSFFAYALDHYPHLFAGMRVPTFYLVNNDASKCKALRQQVCNHKVSNVKVVHKDFLEFIEGRTFDIVWFDSCLSNVHVDMMDQVASAASRLWSITFCHPRGPSARGNTNNDHMHATVELAQEFGHLRTSTSYVSGTGKTRMNFLLMEHLQSPKRASPVKRASPRTPPKSPKSPRTPKKSMCTPKKSPRTITMKRSPRLVQKRGHYERIPTHPGAKQCVGPVAKGDRVSVLYDPGTSFVKWHDGWVAEVNHVFKEILVRHANGDQATLQLADWWGPYVCRL